MQQHDSKPGVHLRDRDGQPPRRYVRYLINLIPKTLATINFENTWDVELTRPSFLFRSVDFCLWAPPDPNSTIGEEEAKTVAWCTKTGHGTRIIPAGTIRGVQFLKAPSYLLVGGTMNQVNINLQANDSGGEMDPHGADLVGTSILPFKQDNVNLFPRLCTAW
jgi:hypothetical protein